MSEQNVMINTERPLIIYESMSFELDTLDVQYINLELSEKALQVNGKRGGITLEYNLLSDGNKVGRGCKRMVLSGLRDFDQVSIDVLVETYAKRKEAFSST